MNDFNWIKYENMVREFVRKQGGNPDNYKFFRDGVVNESKWNEADNIKVLFLLKEVNDQCEYSEEEILENGWLSLVNKKDVPDIFEEYMWRKLAFIYKGICEAIKNDCEADPEQWTYFRTEEGKNSFSKEEQEYWINKVAVMNLKKLGGGGYADKEKSSYTVHYKEHCEEFALQIKEQIEMISPDIIVCCSPEVYDNLNRKVFGFKKKQGNFPIYNENILIVEGYHPTYENRVKEDFKYLFYADVINCCYKFWKSK